MFVNQDQAMSMIATYVKSVNLCAIPMMAPPLVIAVAPGLNWLVQEQISRHITSDRTFECCTRFGIACFVFTWRKSVSTYQRRVGGYSILDLKAVDDAAEDVNRGSGVILGLA